MITIQQNFNAPTARGFSLVDDGEIFDVFEDIENVIISPGTETQDILDDVDRTTQDSPTYYKGGKIGFGFSGFGEAVFSSLDPSIATVNSLGTITRVSDGFARILVTVDNYTKVIKVDVREITPNQLTVSGQFLAGTLGKHISDNIDNKISGKTKAANANIFSSQDHTNRVFVRDPNVWTGGVDLTCISPSNSRDAFRRAGILFSPTFILTAGHYDLQVGDTIYFVDNSNNTVPRTIVQKAFVSSYTENITDITVCRLNSPLPASITPCKLPPKDVEPTYIKQMPLGLPASLHLDQEKKALVGDVYSTLHGVNNHSSRHLVPTRSDRLEFFETKIAGDSGSGAFWIIDAGGGEELALLNLWLSGTSGGSGVSVNQYIPEINQIISDLDAAEGAATGETVSTLDLSAFPTF